VAPVALDVVAAGPADQLLPVVVADDPVGTRPAADDVVAVIGLVVLGPDHVVATERDDHVAMGSAADVVAALVADDGRLLAQAGGTRVGGRGRCQRQGRDQAEDRCQARTARRDPFAATRWGQSGFPVVHTRLLGRVGPRIERAWRGSTNGPAGYEGTWISGARRSASWRPRCPSSRCAGRMPPAPATLRSAPARSPARPRRELCGRAARRGRSTPPAARAS